MVGREGGKEGGKEGGVIFRRKECWSYQLLLMVLRGRKGGREGGREGGRVVGW